MKLHREGSIVREPLPDPLLEMHVLLVISDSAPRLRQPWCPVCAELFQHDSVQGHVPKTVQPFEAGEALLAEDVRILERHVQPFLRLANAERREAALSVGRTEPLAAVTVPSIEDGLVRAV